MANGKWHSVESIEVGSETVSATIVVPPESPWFSGHFPGDPVLPAIAQLAIVLDVAGDAAGLELIPKTVKRTKYRRVIRPGEIIDILLSRTGKNPVTYAFELSVDGEPACKGQLTAAPVYISH